MDEMTTAHVVETVGGREEMRSGTSSGKEMIETIGGEGRRGTDEIHASRREHTASTEAHGEWDGQDDWGEGESRMARQRAGGRGKTERSTSSLNARTEMPGVEAPILSEREERRPDD